MPDGPAGLRISPEVGVDADGKFPLGAALGGLFAELMDEESLKAFGLDSDQELRDRKSSCRERV